MKEISGTQVHAKIAVLYDWENRWAMEDAQGPRNEGLYYKESVEKSYYAFRKMGLDVDVIDMEQDLEPYTIVAIPMLYMFRAGFEKKLRKFIENGGIAIMTYWSGIVDSTDLCYLGGTPHGLMDVFGLRSTEIDALYDWEINVSVPMKGNSLGLNDKWKCKNLCEIVKVSTAEVLGVYGDDFYAGMPTVTKNPYGKGTAYYVCADFEQGFYDELMEKILAFTTLEKPVKVIPEGVEITTRKSEQNEYIFVQNFNNYDVDIVLELENSKIILQKNRRSLI